MSIAAVIVRSIDIEVWRSANPLSQIRQNGVRRIARPVTVPDVIDRRRRQNLRTTVIRNSVTTSAGQPTVVRMSILVRLPVVIAAQAMNNLVRIGVF